MSVEVKLPQFGMGMSEAIISRWLKKEGEMVLADEVLVEIEAAKATAEVVAPVSGKLLKIMAEEGTEIPVYDVIALIDPIA